MDNTVWIATMGGVIGVNLSWLNEKIDYFNSDSYLRSNADFWEWLSWWEGECFKHLAFCNSNTGRIHTIRGHNNGEV